MDKSALSDEEKKERLRQVIADSIPPVHCNGCDGWMCESRPREEQEAVEDVLTIIWTEIKSW